MQPVVAFSFLIHRLPLLSRKTKITNHRWKKANPLWLYWWTKRNNRENSSFDEVDKCIEMQVEDNEVHTNPLSFWNQKQQRVLFLNLTRLACRFFAIPCSSAAVERQFSAAGQIVAQRLSNLDPSTVNNMLFLRSIENNINLWFFFSLSLAYISFQVFLCMFIFVHLFIYTNGISVKIYVFILFLVVEIFICTIIILWEINSSTRKECALRRNKQNHFCKHTQWTLQRTKSTMFYCGWAESNRVEYGVNRIESNPNCDFYTIFGLWYVYLIFAYNNI